MQKKKGVEIPQGGKLQKHESTNQGRHERIIVLKGEKCKNTYQTGYQTGKETSKRKKTLADKKKIGNETKGGTLILGRNSICCQWQLSIAVSGKAFSDLGEEKWMEINQLT